MNHLKELPAGTIWPHLLTATERDTLEDVRQYAESRLNDIARRGDARARAFHIAGTDTTALAEAHSLVHELVLTSQPTAKHAGTPGRPDSSRSPLPGERPRNPFRPPALPLE